MKTVKVIFKQLWNFVTKAKYPCIETWGSWKFGFHNHNCQYYHIDTLVSYLKKQLYERRHTILQGTDRR